MDKLSDLAPENRFHYQSVYNLLRYFDENEQTLDSFWQNHYIRLNKCLDLRKFEQNFKNIRIVILNILSDIDKVYDSNYKTENDYETVLKQLHAIKHESKAIIDESLTIYEQGMNLLNNSQTKTDGLNIDTNPSPNNASSIEPKCDELKRLIEDLNINLGKSSNYLNKNLKSIQKVNALRENFENGNKLYENQQMTPMDFEKSKKYASDIDTWFQKAFKDIDFELIAEDVELNNREDLKSISEQLLSLNSKLKERHETLLKLQDRYFNETVQNGESQDLENNKSNTFPLNTNRKMSFDSMNLQLNLHSLQYKNTREKLSKTDKNYNEAANMHTEKRYRMVLTELIQTEKTYVQELEIIINGYLKKLQSADTTNGFENINSHNLDILFGNISQIYEFHKVVFLKELEKANYSIDKICTVFNENKNCFYLYASYCQNKPLSNEVWQEHCANSPIFKNLQLELGHILSLNTYLLKPVQRISKYQLLLKELHKCSTNAEDKEKIEKSLSEMLEIMNNLNDIMHSTYIVGMKTSLAEHGQLLKRGDHLFMSKTKRPMNSNKSKFNKFNYKQVDLFLFDKTLIICKRKLIDDSNDYRSNLSISLSSLAFNAYTPLNSHVVYQLKETISMDRIGLTEMVKNDNKTFEIWSDAYSYVFEAKSELEKQSWIRELKKLLEYQLDQMKLKQAMLNDNELLIDPKYPKQVTKSTSSEKNELNKNGPCQSLNQFNVLKVRTENEGRLLNTR